VKGEWATAAASAATRARGAAKRRRIPIAVCPLSRRIRRI